MRTALYVSITASVLLAPIASAEPEPKAAPPGEPIRVLGFLTEQGDQRCLPGDREEWVNKRFELGFVRVVSSATELRPLLKTPVLARGRTAPDYVPPAVTHEAPCPMMQMRSDWVMGMDGIRLERGESQGPSAVRLDEAATWKGLVARVEGESLIITIENDLGGPVEAVVTYEGCYGKPNQLAERRPVPVGRTELRLPPLVTDVVEQPRKGIDPGELRHAAHSVMLVGDVPGLALNLDVPLSALGADVRCPDRSTK